MDEKLGLCATCRFGQLIASPRGSQFLLCEKSKPEAGPSHPQFPKYPRLPVVVCPGYERK